ncbi:MAG: bifunctional DNA primase/polymerase [Mycobacterium sp.]|nr:bifunctional DNA primase/polymerase [Mycobacterium sp.]
MNAPTTAEQHSETIARMLRLGCQLIRLAPGVKTPKGGESWKLNPTITSLDEALAWVAAGGGLGVDLARSGMICLDAEDKAATHAVVDAGLMPTVITAKGQVNGHEKQWGTHAWFQVPDGVDPFTIPSGSPKRMGLELPKGGKIDVLSGVKYAVAPPTQLDVTGTRYDGTQGGLLDLTLPESSIPVAPAWLFDPTLPAPPSLAPLSGCLEPEDPREAYDRMAASADSIELTDAVDSVSWSEWLAGDLRLSPTSEVDTCGCPIYHWHRSDNAKSLTLHEGCEKGCGAHVWSATMMTDLGLHGEHVSRLDLACALREESYGTVAASVGIPLRSHLAAVTAEDLEEFADDLDADADRGETEVSAPGPSGANLRLTVGEAGLRERAAKFRAGAASLSREAELWTPLRTDPAGSYRELPVAGWTPTLGALALAPEPVADVDAAVQVIEGLPTIDPLLPAYAARAAEEASAAVPDINPGNRFAAGLLPTDLRSLAAAVAGPRACPTPVDIELSHGAIAEAIGAAVGGTKLRFTTDLEVWYGWDGVRWEENRAAPRVAVQGLLNRRGQSSDPVHRQRKIRTYLHRKLTKAQISRFAKVDGWSVNEDGMLEGPNGIVIETIAVEVPTQAEATQTQNAVITQLGVQDGVATRTGELDARPDVVATPGGYLVLGPDGVTVTPPDPDLLVTKLIGAIYDAAAECPMWDKALADALPDPEVRAFLQRVVGQALIGRQDVHLLLLLRGTGGNGKGLVLDVLEALFGSYGVKLATSVYTLAGAANHATDRMPLRGARFAVVDEIPAKQLNLDLIKADTGGGTATARGIAKDPVSWSRSHTLAMSTNNALQWPPSAVRAMERRLQEIRFEQEFGAEDGPALVEGLAADIVAAELSGVLNWAVEGYLDYLRRGKKLDPPAVVQQWSRETITASSSWSSFCDEMFEVTGSDADTLLASEVWQVWEHFRAADTDQRHASPGSVRALPGMVVDQLKRVKSIPSKGRQRATLVGLRWSEAGMQLLGESRQGAVPAIGIAAEGITVPRTGSV